MRNHKNEPLRLGPDDVAALDSVRFTIAEIAAVFAVPESHLHDGSSSQPCPMPEPE